jgi:hypothetical protein
MENEMVTWNHIREEKRLDGIQEHLRHDIEVRAVFPNGKRIVREKEKRNVEIWRPSSIETILLVEKQKSELNILVLVGVVLVTLAILDVLFRQ